MKSEKILWAEHQKIKQSGLVTLEWLSNLEKIQSIPTDYGALWKNFLQYPPVQQTMFMNSQGELMRHQIALVKSVIPQHIHASSLKESDVGNPPTVMVDDIKTSHNTIHHNYHIARYIKTMGIDAWTSCDSFVEWGGGYGNFARIVRSINPGSTYSIIDLPLFSMIQYRYLSEIFGQESVVVVEPGQPISKGKINIVPSTYWEEVSLEGIMCVSTWALSESPKTVQEKVFAKGLFGSKKGLFSFHQCGYHIPFMDESIFLKDHLSSKEFQIEDVKVIPGINFYAFK